ncbi:MAG: permease-like cell division protein FtsX [bacterium]|nr:permease-like cell division protein FtsX [bacterium]
MLTTFSRSIRAAAIDFKRNLRLSFFTILFLLVALFFVDAFFLTRVLMQTTLGAIEDRIDITLYFKDDAKEKDVLAFREDLQKLDGVKSVLYLSPDEVLQRFKDRHKTDTPLIASLDLLEGNPLGARLVLDIISPTFFGAIKERILGSPSAEFLVNTDFTDNEALIARVTGFTHKVGQATTVSALFFIIMALIAVYSTMSIVVAGHSEDIRVMHMVGATPSFIRLPFIFLQIAYTLIALVLNAIVIGSGFFFLQKTFDLFFFGLPMNPLAVILSHVFLYSIWKVVGAMLFVAIIAMAALRRYVRPS